MAQATVSRRRPCRSCGGRYFVTTVPIFAAVLAFAAALGGIVTAVAGSGIVAAVAGGSIPEPAALLQDGAWAVGGIVLAGVIVLIGRGHRCIKCDVRQ
ncbi:hypothetical protein ACIA5G_19890 [Amycolatopsis sp. NPDC051758]|uniref:hypothetical protein n=1 Tax=Amycolatopsis sp. NPDC051758 TaxID=3363935 RepID=UPI0037B03FCF